MQAVQSILKDEAKGAPRFSLKRATGSVGRGLRRVFGCWHLEMGRPQTQGAETYRACLDCGARRSFDTESWEMKGGFYYQSHAPRELYATMSGVARKASRRPSFLKAAA